MDKINTKMVSNQHLMQKGQQEAESLNQNAYAKQNSATAYGTGFNQSSSMNLGMNPQAYNPRNQTQNQNFYQAIDHKQAVNELYNKRQSHTSNLYQQNKDLYKNRMEYDKQLV